jgi:hypothetical protein
MRQPMRPYGMQARIRKHHLENAARGRIVVEYGPYIRFHAAKHGLTHFVSREREHTSLIRTFP